MPATKEVNYHEFFDFAIQEAKKNPNITVNEVLELFQGKPQSASHTEIEAATSRWTNKQVDEYITNSIRREKFNTGY